MKRILLCLFLIPLFSSCERLFFEEELSEDNPFESYDYLWEQVDRNYSYFEVKNIDWNKVKSRYRSELYGGMSEDSLFRVMGKMLTVLKDDHANLKSSFNLAFYGVRYDGPDNYDQRIVIDNYIGRNHFVSGPFAHNWIASNQIGYIRFSAFSGEVNQANLDYVFGKYRNASGLILDLRENGGGAISDMYAILGRLIDQKTVVYYSRIRNGKDHTDFSDLEPGMVEPGAGPRFTNKPVMVLIDRGTYSAGSFTSLACKSLLNIKLVGDTTGGGLGLPNGGHLPNGWFYRFSVTQALTNDQAARLNAGQEAQINAENYEQGVPPDYRVILNRSDVSKDEVIDFAIQQILN